jgi:serine/threonine protein kinase
VFLARDGEIRRDVALKEIRRDRSADDASVGRFVQEAEITGQLEHPGVVPIYGAGVYPDGRPYYAMRFIEGKELKAAIAELHSTAPVSFGGGNFRELLGRFVSVCQAVAFAHSRGVLHRDLKPGNIMLGPFGETLVVDWGLAKVMHAPGGDLVMTSPPEVEGPGETVPGRALGTPGYMSPEQAGGALADLGPPTDVYSLGAVLHAILTGASPVSTDGGASAMMERARRGEILNAPHAPRPLVAIARKAMALQPERRYSSALDLAADVNRWLADEPVACHSESWMVRFGR